MWLLFIVLIFGWLCDSTFSIDDSPDTKEFADRLNHYSPASRHLVCKILKTIQVYDCYDSMVSKKRVLWTGGELTVNAFDALEGLKRSQKEFTDLISKCLIVLKELHTSLRQIPDIVGQIDVENGDCFMGGYVFKKEDCADCRRSIPGFKSKAKSLAELRQIILDLQITTPKQFLYYTNDIFVIMAEAIRIIDKMWTCLETEYDTSMCESRDKAIELFAKKMAEIATKEHDHVKMVKAERTKMLTIVAQLALEVEASLKAMASCLNLKKGLSMMGIWNKGDIPLSFERRLLLKFKNIKITDTTRVVNNLQNKTFRRSIGSMVAKLHSKNN